VLTPEAQEPSPVSLRDQIQADLTAAMRSGDAPRRDALRMLWNAIYTVEKRERVTLDDAATLAVLTRELKTRRESIEAFRGAGREDLAAPEEVAVEIVSAYLPRQLREDEVRDLVAEAIAATGASTPRDLGRVMGWISPRTRGRADGKVVSALVAQALAPEATGASPAGGGGPA
jgi:uncharacterized protein YqeY